mgnify:CR=1 FL=1
MQLVTMVNSCGVVLSREFSLQRLEKLWLKSSLSILPTKFIVKVLARTNYLKHVKENCETRNILLLEVKRWKSLFNNKIITRTTC